MPTKSEDALDILWLKAFLAVFYEGTFDGAAKAVGCSQSTVSNRVTKLRGWLGAPLFVCEKSGARPTNFALSFRPTAEDVLAKLEGWRQTNSTLNSPSMPQADELAALPEVNEPPAEELPWWKRVFGA